MSHGDGRLLLQQLKQRLAREYLPSYTHQSLRSKVEAINREEHINFHEVYAILVALQRWGALFARSRLIVNTDNTNAFHGLQSNRLRGNANQILRRVLCIAAQYDIIIEPKWLNSEENALADALSRSDYIQIANLCPHWQIPYSLAECRAHSKLTPLLPQTTTLLFSELV